VNIDPTIRIAYAYGVGTTNGGGGAENAGVENAGVENAGVDSRGITTDEFSR